MNISQTGIDLIKHYEGCSLQSYQDSTGIWTIGWGTTKNVKQGQTITQEEADLLLQNDVEIFGSMLSNKLPFSIPQNQFDALTSFLYNIGPGAKGIKDGLFSLRNGEPSTLWKNVIANNTAQATGQFLLWDKAGGKVLLGLQRRRKSESILYSINKLEFFG